MLKKLALAFLLAILAQGTAFAGHKYVIVNNLGKDVCGFFVAPHGTTNWSADMVAGLGQCLHNGNTTTYNGKPSSAQSHDVRVVFKDGTDLKFTTNQRYAEGGTATFELNKAK